MKLFDENPLAFGGASISGESGGYGFGNMEFQDALNLLEQAYEGGIRVFDSAPIYGFGESERRIGQAFKAMREKVFFVSKSGVDWHDNKRVNMTNDPIVTQKMLEQSLRTFESDYIDLYMIHWPDKKIDIRRPMEVLMKAKAQGKIRHIGLCNTFVEDLQKALEIDKVDVVQNQLNFFVTWPIENLFPFLSEKMIRFMSWGTLDKGVLTGRVTKQRKYDSSDCRSWAPWWKEENRDPKFMAMERLTPWMEKQGITGLELAVSHNLMYQECSTVLVGAKNSNQLSEVFKAVKNPLDRNIVEKAIDLANYSGPRE